jgi:hypothetical protein
MKTFNGWDDSPARGANISGLSAYSTGYMGWSVANVGKGLITYIRVIWPPQTTFRNAFYLIGIDFGEDFYARAEYENDLYYMCKGLRIDK